MSGTGSDELSTSVRCQPTHKVDRCPSQYQLCCASAFDWNEKDMSMVDGNVSVESSPDV